VLLRPLGPLSLSALLGCAPAQPTEAPTASTSRTHAAPAEADPWSAAAEGDPELARALREARSLELQPGVAPDRMVGAWKVVVELAGEKAIGELAAERVAEWSRAIDAPARRATALRLLRTTFEKDVGRVESGALSVEEFCVGYRPHLRDLEELKVTPPYTTICRGK
jgi:hypothetical protein